MALLPINSPRTAINSKSTGNIFQRWSLLGPDFVHRDRYTPLGNPREIAHTWVHWCTVYKWAWNPKKIVDDIDSLKKFGLQSVHVMGLARPQLDDHKGVQDERYQKFGDLLEIKLQQRLQILNELNISTKFELTKNKTIYYVMKT